MESSRNIHGKKVTFNKSSFDQDFSLEGAIEEERFKNQE